MQLLRVIVPQTQTADLVVSTVRQLHERAVLRSIVRLCQASRGLNAS